MNGFGCAVSLWISGPVRNSQVGGKGSGPVQQNGVFRRFFMRVTLTTVSDWISKPQDLHPHCCVIPRGMHRNKLRDSVRFDHENELMPPSIGAVLCRGTCTFGCFNRVLTRAALSNNDRVWSSGVRGGGARPSEV